MLTHLDRPGNPTVIGLKLLLVILFRRHKKRIAHIVFSKWMSETSLHVY